MFSAVNVALPFMRTTSDEVVRDFPHFYGVYVSTVRPPRKFGR